MTDADTALAVIEQGALVPAAMGDNFRRYRTLQADIDKAMPDCIIKIQGRDFRRKNYWRAVGVAFGLRVELVSEERIERTGDWGYMAIYRAIAKNGMSADGDGICMASEKHGGQATEHNVRSHGHTRAYNRAISNLVGFGEVSAEEVEREEPRTAYVPSTSAAKVGTVASADHIPFDLEGNDNTPIPDTDPPEGFTYITKVSKRTGTKKSSNEPYSQWFVGTADGKEGSTFDGQLAVTAEAAMASKIPVLVSWEQKGQYTNLVSILRA